MTPTDLDRLDQRPSIRQAENCHQPTAGTERLTETATASQRVTTSELLLDLHQQALDSILKLTEATAARLESLNRKGST